MNEWHVCYLEQYNFLSALSLMKSRPNIQVFTCYIYIDELFRISIIFDFLIDFILLPLEFHLPNIFQQKRWEKGKEGSMS